MKIQGIEVGNLTRLPLVCTCGASCKKALDLKRFLRRHPKLCTERAAFTKQLATTTRSVDFDDALHAARVRGGYEPDVDEEDD